MIIFKGIFWGISRVQNYLGKIRTSSSTPSQLHNDLGSTDALPLRIQTLLDLLQPALDDHGIGCALQTSVAQGGGDVVVPDGVAYVFCLQGD